jgi:2-polyprenyl-3-methyl-5-hydroxy-6-metoxy-1,4-benzoquinol methylase
VADQGAEGLLSPFLRSLRLRTALPHVTGRVLDVGCGSGAVASRVPADRYVGVDTDERALALARALHAAHRFQSDLPPREPGFDTILCLAVLEHIADPAEFLRSLADRLGAAPGSVIVCTTPHPAVDRVHRAGAALRLFSRHAAEEHQAMLDRPLLDALARDCGLTLAVYRRFQLGANQLAVFRRGCAPGAA